jgi:hypothetical protein
VALGIELKTASTGPFAQFQNCADDDESLTNLVFQLVNRIPGSEPDRETIRFQVGKFKSSIEGILKTLSAPASPSAAKRQKQDEIENSSAKLFEEIKIMFQDLPSRIERTDVSRSVRRRKRLHPGMIEEIMFRSKNPLLGVRVGLSLLRDVLPWVYDEGCALLTRLQSAKTPAVKKRILDEFEELLMINTRSSYIEKYLVESEEDFLLIHEVPRMIMHALSMISSEA